MTTIFCSAKHGVMVSDSKMTIGGTWVTSTKITRHGDHLIGMSGDSAASDKWLEWWISGQKGPKPKIPNSNGLLLGPEGVLQLTGDGEFVPIERGFHGIGSGGDYAVAAFMAGADPKKSVEIACQIDLYSGGAIQVEKLRK